MLRKVYELYCKNCNTNITNRGQSVSLRADSQVKCFSSDFSTEQMITLKQIKQFNICPCIIQDIGCKKCQIYLGYHVVAPCQQCLANNNGHYFLFHQVYGKQTQILWKDLSSLYRQKDLKDTNIAQQFQCPICLEILVNPTIISCGHTFCRTCIERHIDLYVNCPVDKIQMNRFGPFIRNRLIEDLIHKRLLSTSKEKLKN